jgi:carbonic anhydrase
MQQSISTSSSVALAAALIFTSLPACSPPAAPEAPEAPAADPDAAASTSPSAPGAHQAPPGVEYLAAESGHGGRQSPINIVSARAQEGTHQIRVRYVDSREHVSNLGHTVQVAFDEGSFLDFDGVSYALRQFHFHTPAEHLVDGVTYPMELHLVHVGREDASRFLVVGVLFREGQPNATLGDLITAVPGHAGERVDRDTRINATTFFRPPGRQTRRISRTTCTGSGTTLTRYGA